MLGMYIIMISNSQTQILLSAMLALQCLKALRQKSIAAQQSEQCYCLCAVHSGCLLTAWQQSSHSQKRHLLNLLVRQVHDISEEEAQALPEKDLDTNGCYDKVLNWLNTRLGRT